MRLRRLLDRRHLYIYRPLLPLDNLHSAFGHSHGEHYFSSARQIPHLSHVSYRRPLLTLRPLVTPSQVTHIYPPLLPPKHPPQNNTYRYSRLLRVNKYTLFCLGYTGCEPARKKKTQVNAAVSKVEPSAQPSLPLRHTSLLRTFKDLILTMPSFLRGHSRAFSYPPGLDNVDDGLPDIDDEPFAHFLTPVSEEDNPYDPSSFNAGIVAHDYPRTIKTSKFKSNVSDKWARYVKQNHTQLHTRYHHATIPEEDEESFMGLDDERLNDTPHTVTQITTPRVTVLEPTRGRAQELVDRKERNRRRYSRTLSGHRHSWREPSPELFDIDESEEEESVAVRRAKLQKAKDGAERRRSSTRSKSRARPDMSERSRL